jgi:CRP-like cAMP-binding protein
VPIERQLVQALPLFADLDDEAIERICTLATEVELPASAVLIERNQPASGLFVVLDGTVEVETRGGGVTLGPGDVVGELGLLADAQRSARVCAITPVRCIAIARGDFDALLEAEPRIAVPLLRTLARRLLDAT